MSDAGGGWFEYRFETADPMIGALFLTLSQQPYSFDLITNMLGDPLYGPLPDPDGSLLMVARGRYGNGTLGDPGTLYFALRSKVPPDGIPFKSPTCGIVESDPAVSKALLGVWA